jgi:hypothetical protein
MARAIAYPEPAKTAPGREAPATVSATDTVPHGRLSMARAVLRFSAELADAVMAGRALAVSF